MPGLCPLLEGEFTGNKDTRGFSEATEAGQAVGPYPVSHCRHWVGEGRLNGHTKVQEGKSGRGPSNDSNDIRLKVILLASYCKQFRGFSIHHYGLFPIIVMN